MTNGCVQASPDYVQTSLAGAMALGLARGGFYRDARPGSLNLLMTYPEGCKANCGYCGLARGRRSEPDDATFIRVKWPVHELDEIIRILQKPSAKAQAGVQRLGRICVSMVTHPQAGADCLAILGRLAAAVSTPLSVLTAPTLLTDRPAFFRAIRQAGADWAGVAIDAATPELFAALRGDGVAGPHGWDTYWQALAEAVDVFGPGRVSAHFIAGLGETEEELVRAMSLANKLGAQIHLFAFCPEPGSGMSQAAGPSLGQYRRIQLTGYLLNHGLSDGSALTFGEGRILGYGQPLATLLGADLAGGEPFMTSGCPDANGCLACNRPFGNERPGPVLRNYPFRPDAADLAKIRDQIWHD